MKSQPRILTRLAVLAALSAWPGSGAQAQCPPRCGPPHIIVSHEGGKIEPYNPATGVKIPPGSTPVLSHFRDTTGVYVPKGSISDPPGDRVRTPGGQTIKIPPGEGAVIKQVGGNVEITYPDGHVVTLPGTYLSASTPDPLGFVPPEGTLREQTVVTLSPAEAQVVLTNILADPALTAAFGQSFALSDVAFDFNGTAPLFVGTGPVDLLDTRGGVTTFTVTTVPEPSTAATLALGGLAVVGLLRRARTRRRDPVLPC